MSSIVAAVTNNFENMASFLRISRSYLKKHNPLVNTIKNTLFAIQDFLATKQKLKALKYRVQLMNYRIYQMDQVIQQNNPHNYIGGRNINQLR